MNIPLIIIILLNTIGLGVSLGTHGEERKPENFWTALASYIISITLLYLAFKN